MFGRVPNRQSTHGQWNASHMTELTDRQLSFGVSPVPLRFGFVVCANPWSRLAQ
jgi:hypothetical protein